MHPHRAEERRVEGATAAAWLLITSEPLSLAELSGEHCLAIARNLLAAAGSPLDGRDPSPTFSSPVDRLTAVADEVPAVGVWLTTRSAADSIDPVIPGGPAIGRARAEGDSRFISRLARSLVLPGEEMAPSTASGRQAGAEAVMLRDAVRLFRDHLELLVRFERAVADARLEAMRELAYGAGHEINNPLANIATRAQALLLEETDPERRRRLSTIVDQSFRARDMIGGLMLFARPPSPRRESADLGGILAAVIESVRAQAAARSVRLEYSPSPVPEFALVDRVQVEEAIRLIVVNALEAVKAEGRVVLEVAHRSMAAGGGCEITVTDDGRGMSPEVARRAFDPFFSGREAGRGAGLGLSKAWRLIESNGGTVLLDSHPGQGTRMTIRLPEASRPPAVAFEPGGEKR